MIEPSVEYELKLNDTNQVKSFVKSRILQRYSLPYVQANDKWHFSSKP